MKNVITVFCMLIILLAISCSSNEEPTTGLKKKNIESLVQTFALDLSSANSLSFETDAGCRFTFDPSGFTNDGSAVTGTINVDVVEIFDKGTMAITGKHTMTDNSILISGGEFHVRAYQGDNELDYQNIYQIEVPFNLSGEFSNDMELFTGGEELISSQNWVPAPESDIRGVLVDSAAYILRLTGFSWFNCDRFYDDPRPLVSLDVKVPSEFTIENSDIYLAMKGEKSSLGKAAGGEYPIGLEVHLIFVSELDDQFLYQIISTTVSEDEYKFERNKMQTATPKELEAIINALE